MQEIGQELLVFYDKPENAILKLIDGKIYTAVVYNREICPNEVQIERNVRAAVYK